MSILRRPLAPFRQALSRAYTDFHHVKYPIMYEYAIGVPLYWIFFYCMLVRAGSMYSGKSEYKHDTLRGWRRKLGTGYKWSTEWGAPLETFYKDLPSSAE